MWGFLILENSVIVHILEILKLHKQYLASVLAFKSYNSCIFVINTPMHQWIHCKGLILYKDVSLKKPTKVVWDLAAVSCAVKWVFRFNRLLAFLDSKQLSNGCLDLCKREGISGNMSLASNLDILVYCDHWGEKCLYSNMKWIQKKKMTVCLISLKISCIVNIIWVGFGYDIVRLWRFHVLGFFPSSLPSTN